jgi:hypothetical protein
MASDLGPQIDSTAGGPAEAEADGQRVKAQPLKDLIEADRYRKASAAAALPRRGISFTKLQMPGALGQSGDAASDFGSVNEGQ